MTTAGSLLIASPTLPDPFFAGSVIYMLKWDLEGSYGIVINKPTALSVKNSPGAIASWAEYAAQPGTVFQGGPVNPAAYVAVGEARNDDETPGMTRLGHVVTIDMMAPQELVVPEISRMRVFNSYASWHPFQVEQEIQMGCWVVRPGCANDVFQTDVSTMWNDKMGMVL